MSRETKQIREHKSLLSAIELKGKLIFCVAIRDFAPYTVTCQAGCSRRSTFYFVFQSCNSAKIWLNV